VFFDKKGHRRRFVGYVTFILTALITIIAGLFIVSVLINPFLPQLRLKPAAILPQKIELADPLPARPPLTKKEASIRQVAEKLKLEKQRREEARLESQAKHEMLSASQPAPTPSSSVPGRSFAVGFYVNWDYSSFTSLKENMDKLDWMVPEWIRISGEEANPLVLDIDDKAMSLIHQQRPDLPILPRSKSHPKHSFSR